MIKEKEINNTSDLVSEVVNKTTPKKRKKASEKPVNNPTPKVTELKPKNPTPKVTEQFHESPLPKYSTDEILYSSEVDNLPPTPSNEEGNEESSSEIYRDLFSPRDIDMKSDLTPNLIIAMAKGKIYADRFNVQVVKDLQLNILRLMVSKNRLGRSEILDIYKAEKRQFDIDPLLPSHMLGKL